jgi:8-oxo-dGTP diphosphatase
VFRGRAACYIAEVASVTAHKPAGLQRLKARVVAMGVRLWRWLPLKAQYLLLWGYNAHYIVGTVAIVRDADGLVLVARHTYRSRMPWGLPGGWVRRDEDPARAVVREIREETGLELDVLGTLTVQLESPVHLTVIYDARLTGGTFRPSQEVSAVKFVSPGEYLPGLREDHRRLIERFARPRTRA